MTAFDDTVKALGGSFLTEPHDDYGSWTPNSLKTLVLTHTGGYLEYHGNPKGKLFRFKTPFRPDQKERSPLRALSFKQFGTLESIIAPASMYVDVPLQKYFSDQTRFGGYFLVLDDAMPPVDVLAKALYEERLAYVQNSPLDYDPRPVLPDTPNALGVVQGIQGVSDYVQVKPFTEVIESFSLAPQVYSADTTDGKVSTLLSSLKGTTPSSDASREDMQDLEDDDDNDEGDFDDEDTQLRLYEFDHSELKPQILDLLRFSAEQYKQGNKEFLVAMSKQCCDLSSLPETPVWYKVILPKHVGAKFQEDSTGVLLDCEDTTRAAKLFLYTLPQSTRASLGYSDVPSDVTLDDVLDALQSGDSEGDADTADDDTVDDEYLEFYLPQIQGRVESLIAEYTKIFESGYAVMKPVGVLTADDAGQGRCLAIDKNGYAYNAKYSSVVIALWEEVQKYLSLTPVKERNIKEIARIVVTGSSSDGTEYRGNLYFPYKMLEYAFGREAFTGDQLSYPRHSSATSWDQYCTDEVRKSLTETYKMVIQVILQSVGNYRETFASPEVRSLVAENLEKLSNALSTCVLLSSFDVIKSKPVRVKLRVLDPRQGIFGTPAANLVHDAILEAISYDGGSASQMYAPVTQGIFTEFRHDVNTLLANTAPVWSYRLLESQLSQGKALSGSNIILGLGMHDEVITSEMLGLNRHTSHITLAGSRSGKGLYTQAVSAGKIASGIPGGAADDKPDMASVFLFINPDAFVINGPDVSNSGEGNDLFNQFTEDRIHQLEDMAHIPPYLDDLATWTPGYRGTLGMMAYMRYVILSLGILAARVHAGSVTDVLGGSEGIFIIFDEISNFNKVFANFLREGNAKHLLYTQYRQEWEDWQKAGGKDKKRPSYIMEPVDLWFTAVHQSLRKSASRLSQLRNAGFNNAEARKSDVFLIGQDPVTSLDDIREILPDMNKSSKGRSIRITDNQNIIWELASIGATDAIIGYHSDYPSYLDQAHTSADKLNSARRCFGYVPSFAGKKIEQALLTGDKSVAESATYFRPGLLFADGSEEGYCWQNAMKFMADAGLDVDAVRESVLTEDGHLNPALGFLGYLQMAGCSKEQAAATLQKMTDAANYVVQKMGYPGTWLEFVLDLRPEWVFSVDDIYRLFSNEKFDSPCSRDFQRYFPDLIEANFDQSGGINFGKTSDYTFTDPDEDTWNLDADSEENSDDDWGLDDLDESSEDAMPEDSFEPIRSELPDIPEEDIVPSQLDLPYEEGFYSGLGDSGATVGLHGSVSQPMGNTRLITPTELSPDAIQKAITDDLRGWVGSFSRVKLLSVRGGILSLNRTGYKTAVGDSLKGNVTVPPYMTEAIRTSNVAAILDWSVLKEMQNLTRFSVDAWDFFLSYIAPDLGYSSTTAVGSLFADLPRLQIVSIAGKEYTRAEYSKENGVPSGVRRYDEMQQAMAVGTRYLSRGRQGTWQYLTNTWRRQDIGGLGKTFRLGLGLVGLGTTGSVEVASRASQGIASLIGSAIADYRNSIKSVSNKR